MLDAQGIEQSAGQVVDYFADSVADLPSLNAQAAAMMSMSAKIMAADVTELEMMIRRDPAASADLLKMANSPMFRRNHDVVSISDAIVRLGRQQVFAVIASVAARSLLSHGMRDLYGLFPEEWHLQQNHCVVTAFGAAWFCSKEKWSTYDAAFLGGMFHDIGKIVALQALGRLMLADRLHIAPSDPAFHAVIARAHVPLGLQAVKAWKLPPYLLEICAQHHGSADPTSVHFKLIQGVRLISCLDIVTNDEFAPPEAQIELLEVRRSLALDDEATDSIAAKLAVITQSALQLMRRPA